MGYTENIEDYQIDVIDQRTCAEDGNNNIDIVVSLGIGTKEFMCIYQGGEHGLNLHQYSFILNNRNVDVKTFAKELPFVEFCHPNITLANLCLILVFLQ